MSFLSFSSLVLAFITSISLVTAQENAVVNVPSEYTYLLPSSFNGSNGKDFLDTTSAGMAIPSLAQAKNATFVSFDSEFNNIIGSTPQATLVAQGVDIAFEGGIWVYERDRRNEVWFTSDIVIGQTTIRILDLNTNKVRTPNWTSEIVNPNGGYYWNGQVYFATFGNATYPGGVVAVDPETLAVRTVINSYYGLRFNSPDDVTWAKSGAKTYMYFTDPYFAPIAVGGRLGLPPSQLPNSVYRFDPDEKEVVPVIGRSDISVPNGVSVTADMKKLYVSDSPFNVPYGALNGTASGFSSLWLYDLDSEGRPINKRLFGMPRTGVADGIHIDDAGRVWTGEGEGVVVRNPSGKVIGLFNAERLLGPLVRRTGVSIANFALAGDTLLVLAFNQLWSIKLANTVVSPDRFHS